MGRSALEVLLFTAWVKLVRALLFGIAAIVLGIGAIFGRIDGAISNIAADLIPIAAGSTDSDDIEPDDGDADDAEADTAELAVESTTTTESPTTTVAPTTTVPPTTTTTAPVDRPFLTGPCIDAHTIGAWGGTDFFRSIGMSSLQIDYYGNGVPDLSESALDAKADWLDRQAAVSFDIEDLSNRGWQTEGLSDVSAAAQNFGIFAREMNERSGSPFAFYGTLPIFDYFNVIAPQGPDNRWSQRNDVIAAQVLEHVDYLSPVGYLHSTDLDTELLKLRNLAAESRRVANGKPVILYLSAEVQGIGANDPDRFRPVDYPTMKAYLSTVSPLFDGILFWGWANGNGGGGQSRPFDDPANDGWKQALREHMAAGGCRQYAR